MHNLAGDKLKELLLKSDKTLMQLGEQTHANMFVWARLILGTKRLDLDSAIRLGRVFPIARMNEETALIEPRDYWLNLQHQSDLLNADKLDGKMYRDIKPFE